MQQNLQPQQQQQQQKQHNDTSKDKNSKTNGGLKNHVAKMGNAVSSRGNNSLNDDSSNEGSETESEINEDEVGVVGKTLVLDDTNKKDKGHEDEEAREVVSHVLQTT